jgi:TatD DNase family protein
MLIDSHCHLDFPELAAEEDAVLARARQAGVAAMVTIGTRVRRFAEVRAIAERHADVFCTVGTHPHHAGEEPDIGAGELAAIAADPRVVGIGETGLDFHYDNAPRDVQAKVFRNHLAAARETGLPVVVHTRSADAETGAILEEEAGRGPLCGVLHCFTAGRALALAGIRLGFYISFSGILTFKKSDELRAIAAEVPLDRLLVETDAPYLAPVPRRGRRNEPAFVVHTAAELARVRGLSPAEMARITSQNAARLFTRLPRAALGLAA